MSHAPDCRPTHIQNRYPTFEMTEYKPPFSERETEELIEIANSFTEKWHISFFEFLLNHRLS